MLGVSSFFMVEVEMNKDFILLNAIELALVEPPKSFLGKQSKFRSKIEEIWEIEKNKNPNLFNGPLFSVVEFRIEEVRKDQVLYVFETDYKSFLAEQSGVDLGLQPLGVTGAISKNYFGEEKLLFAQRSKNNSIYGGFWELVPSGGLEFFESDSKEALPIRQLLIEFEEELGASRELIESSELVALSFDSNIKVYDLIYVLKVSTNFTWKLSLEHDDYVFLSEQEFVDSYLDRSLPNCKNVFASLRKSERGI